MSHSPARGSQELDDAIVGRTGEPPQRPDGALKVRGEYAYSSDLRSEDMLWAATLRSPHPHARIRSMNIALALQLPGVAAVLTHEDVPGKKRYGVKIADQPMLAADVVRYRGNRSHSLLLTTRRQPGARWTGSRLITSRSKRSPIRSRLPTIPRCQHCTRTATSCATSRASKVTRPARASRRRRV